MRIIAVANHKGGCGKTTTSINLASCLAQLQKKVILFDLDPQGHSTCGLGIDADKLNFTLYDLFHPPVTGRPHYSQVLAQPEKNLYVAPSCGILAALEEEWIHEPDRDTLLQFELQRMELAEGAQFDYAVLDCPPNLGLLTMNALMACHQILIPIEPSFFSLHGLAKISETIEDVNARRRQPIETRALLTIFDARTSFAREVYEDVKSHFQEKMFKTVIHESVSLKEAAGAGQSITQYDPKSIACQDYLGLATELLEREWGGDAAAQKIGWNHVLYHRYGPRRVAGGVLFQVMSRNSRWVEIAGDFNNWIPEPMVARSGQEPGLWQRIVPITGGKFRYKFIIDGEWQVDPYQPGRLSNAFGSIDSYLELV